jgi:enamine deaminase RidA (YjgF/YER057c/UK114 family)
MERYFINPEGLPRPGTSIVNYKPADRSVMHEVRSRHFSKDAPPASTLVGVQSLALADYLVEIEAVAATE